MGLREKLKEKSIDFVNWFNTLIVGTSIKLIIFMIYIIYKIFFGTIFSISYLLKKNPSIVIYLAIAITIIILFFG